MKDREPDIFHHEAVRKTLDEGEQKHIERTNEDKPVSPVDFNNDLVLQLIHNRIEPVNEQLDISSGPSVREWADIQKAIKKDIKKLQELSAEEREALKAYLMDKEGFDAKTGKKRERGADKGVMSIGVNIYTHEYLLNAETGKHESVIGKLATRTINRTPSFYSEDGADGSYGAESEILYGLIDKNVPGFNLPLVRFKLNVQEGTYKNIYSKPRKINLEKLAAVNDLLINHLHIIPLDTFSSPLIR